MERVLFESCLFRNLIFDIREKLVEIFYDRLSVRIFLLFAIILYLGTRDFFSFFTIEEKKEAEILSRS